MTAGPAIVRAIAAAQHALVDTLEPLADDALLAPSLLPGWDRLTVMCHIRYGGDAINRMVTAGLAGEPVLFYPGGRTRAAAGHVAPAPG